MIPHTYFELVKKTFFGDMSKTWQWFKMPQGELCGQSVIEALKEGKSKKVVAMIQKRCKGMNL